MLPGEVIRRKGKAERGTVFGKLRFDRSDETKHSIGLFKVLLQLLQVLLLPSTMLKRRGIDTVAWAPRAKQIKLALPLLLPFLLIDAIFRFFEWRNNPPPRSQAAGQDP